MSIAAELIQLRWGGAGQALTDTGGRIRITAAGEDRQVASRIAIAATLEIEDAAVAASRLLTPGLRGQKQWPRITGTLISDGRAATK